MTGHEKHIKQTFFCLTYKYGINSMYMDLLSPRQEKFPECPRKHVKQDFKF